MPCPFDGYHNTNCTKSKSILTLLGTWEAFLYFSFDTLAVRCCGATMKCFFLRLAGRIVDDWGFSFIY